MTAADLAIQLGWVGWALIAFGAVSHAWHQQRLRDLLSLHLDQSKLAAGALTALEVALAVALPLAYFAQSTPLLRIAAAVATLLAMGFVAWVARLLITSSELPCACSFSQAPTTFWSLGRAICVALVALLAVADEQTFAAAAAEQVAVLLAGAALGAAIFVLPESLSWPPASKALLARIEAHESSPAASGSGAAQR